MARIRSARNRAVPLRTPRRKTSEEPASRRISRPRAATRAAISSALNALAIFVFKPPLVPLTCSVGHFETVGNFDAGDPDDAAVPHQKRDAISAFGGDFT